MSTILKWAGNKTAIMSELKKHLPAGPRLVEPFAGSCAVMMETDNLQLTERVLVSTDGSVSSVEAVAEPDEPEEMWTVKRG